MSNHQKKFNKAKELKKVWEENEESMAEMAAYHVACEQLEIDPDDGWELLAFLETGKVKS
ncbi:MAG: hypothetical protein ACXQTL_05485 [Methanosarcinales archaeon]